MTPLPHGGASVATDPQIFFTSPKIEGSVAIDTPPWGDTTS